MSNDVFELIHFRQNLMRISKRVIYLISWYILIKTFYLNIERGSETGTNTVDSSAQELSRVVGPHYDGRLRAVDAGLTHLDPCHIRHRSRVCDLALYNDHGVLVTIHQGADIRLQDHCWQICNNVVSTSVALNINSKYCH